MKFVNKLKNRDLFYIISYCILLILVMTIFLSFFRLSVVNGVSMSPTFNDQDVLILSTRVQPEKGDIVAIKSVELQEELCKRLIAVSGDRVKINNEGLYVNDELIEESYVSSEYWFLNYTDEAEIDIIVPPNQVFVLGDNRDNSLDSRKLGCLLEKDILGVSIFNITAVTGLYFRKLLLIIMGICVSILILLIIENIFTFNKEASKSNNQM